jgi:hypothetical protein
MTSNSSFTSAAQGRYYYESDYSKPIQEGESLRDWRLRTYRITQRGMHEGPRGVHWRVLD